MKNKKMALKRGKCRKMSLKRKRYVNNISISTIHKYTIRIDKGLNKV